MRRAVSGRELAYHDQATASRLHMEWLVEGLLIFVPLRLFDGYSLRFRLSSPVAWQEQSYAASHRSRNRRFVIPTLVCASRRIRAAHGGELPARPWRQ